MALATPTLETRACCIRGKGERLNRILVIQTAFAGDLILALPLVQETRRAYPGIPVDVLCIPATAPLLEGHPDVSNVIVHDKRGGGSIAACVRGLRSAKYSLVLCPHRSMRSALLAFGSRALQRVAFDRSAGRFLYTSTIPYRNDVHEIHRNLDLLASLNHKVDRLQRPRLYPLERDRATARAFLKRTVGDDPFICMAPGSVWPTKRWTTEGFTTAAESLSKEFPVVFVGGPEDADRCDRIVSAAGSPRIVTAAGVLSFPASAALIGEARLLVSNDSAPVHIASAMGIPVVDIYGPTSPRYGFAPFGVPYEIVEMKELACRPCAIHGGPRCPIGTFDCMENLEAVRVVAAARRLLTTYS